MSDYNDEQEHNLNDYAACEDYDNNDDDECKYYLADPASDDDGDLAVIHTAEADNLEAFPGSPGTEPRMIPRQLVQLRPASLKEMLLRQILKKSGSIGV